MIGDVHATSAGGAVPLPPAFSQPPVQRPDAEDHRLRPPFFAPASGAAAPLSASPGDAAPAPIAFTAPAPVRAQAPPPEPPRPAGFGGLPSDAIFLPEAPIPKKAKEEEEDDGPIALADPRRRPISASDLAVLVAARLELMARRLRERGSAGLTEAFSGDALDLALAGLISGYIAGRGG
ncbi:MAG TPA: hypothetical protein VF832_09520 [Longimicrobiales bacterium]